MYHQIRLLVNKNFGPSPSTILQIYKQCVRPIFEYGSLSTMTTSDTIISKIQRLQNKFIQLVLRLPKYISVKQVHDSSGLPYVKDRLISCATRTLERISKNLSVEEFPMPAKAHYILALSGCLTVVIISNTRNKTSYWTSKSKKTRKAAWA